MRLGDGGYGRRFLLVLKTWLLVAEFLVMSRVAGLAALVVVVVVVRGSRL